MTTLSSAALGLLGRAGNAFGVLAIGAALLATPAFASDRSDEIKATLQKRFPTYHIDAVMPSPWEGLYEVFTNYELVYATESADRLFVGKMVDTKSGKDLTAERWSDYNRIDFSKLPFEQAIKIVKGDGSRQLAIFEDPFCPYCEELEQELATITDVTVYVFLYPLENLHPGATEAAQKIWCASDRAAAWTAWMQKQQAPTTGSCDTAPIAPVAQLGETMRVNSTPTLFFINGRRISGSIQAAGLESLFQRAMDEQKKVAKK